MREEILEKISNFCLMDDDFMTAVFQKSPECVETVLRVILNKDIKVKTVNTQETISNTFGRSVRLDIFGEDIEGRLYDIEIQRADKGAIPKRARYLSSLLDANTFEKNLDYALLPEAYVIFFTENDIYKLGRPVYYVERKVEPQNLPFNDASHIIYVNGSYHGNDDIGRLVHDFWCKDPKDIYDSTLKERVMFQKNDKEAVTKMCRGVEELCDKSKLEGKEEVAVNLLKKGLAVSEVAEVTEISPDRIEELKNSLTA